MSAELFHFPDPRELPKPKRVILHWTAGKYESTRYERSHYHGLIEYLSDGRAVVVKGVPIVNNLRRIHYEDPTYVPDYPDGYAAHTRLFNSWSIGYSLCAMLDATPEDHGDYPIKASQVDILIGLCRQTAAVFDLEVNGETFFTHWEAEYLHQRPQVGKWDITTIPQLPDAAPWEVGSWLRERINE